MSWTKNYTISKILTYLLIPYLTFAYPINALAQEKGTKRVQDYIAVLDLRIKKGVPEEVKDPLTEKLQMEIINSRKYKVVDRAHRDQILKEQGFQLKDCVSSECIVEAGQLLGVGKMVTGSISKLGEAYYINAQLINVETGVVEASADGMCKECDLDELIYPTAIVAKKLMGLPYKSYEPATYKPDKKVKEEKYPEFKLEGVVNINTATLGQLQLLPGIGEIKAKEIIKYRKEKGEFKSIEDIKNVKGIGDKPFEKIKGNIVVKGVTTVRHRKVN